MKGSLSSKNSPRNTVDFEAACSVYIRFRGVNGYDFPNVFKAINDLKLKDYRQLAYLLQAHESKIMIDVICRRILDELPGTFIATIHDSIMTTPDKAEVVKMIMVREFQRFGLNPMIRLEAY